MLWSIFHLALHTHLETTQWAPTASRVMTALFTVPTQPCVVWPQLVPLPHLLLGFPCSLHCGFHSTPVTYPGHLNMLFPLIAMLFLP